MSLSSPSSWGDIIINLLTIEILVLTSWIPASKNLVTEFSFFYYHILFYNSGSVYHVFTYLGSLNVVDTYACTLQALAMVIGVSVKLYIFNQNLIDVKGCEITENESR